MTVLCVSGMAAVARQDPLAPADPDAAEWGIHTDVGGKGMNKGRSGGRARWCTRGPTWTRETLQCSGGHEMWKVGPCLGPNFMTMVSDV